MAQNIMKIYVNETGNIINTSNLTCVQNSSDNVIRLFYKSNWDFISVTLTQPDGSSEKHFMTIQYDENDDLYAEYVIPSALVSFLISGNVGYLTVSFQGAYYDTSGYLHDGNVINSQITVKYSNNATVLDSSYNKTDIENLWYSIGVINQQLGIGSGDSYLNKVSITQKLNGKQYGAGNLYLYSTDIPLSDTNSTTLYNYLDTNLSELNTTLTSLDNRLRNGSYVVDRASKDSKGNVITDTYVSATALVQYYYSKEEANGLLNDKLSTSDALNTFYTKTEVDNKISGLYRVKGSVETAERLPIAGNVIGDTYNVVDSGVNYVWTGTEWDALGGLTDLSTYASKTYVDTAVSALNTSLSSDITDLNTAVNKKYDKSETYSKTEVNNYVTQHLNNYYNQTEVNGFVNTLTGNIADKANKTDVYTKTQMDNTIETLTNNVGLKANSADVYTKSAMDTMISGINRDIESKADSATTYTKAEVDAMIPDTINMSNYYNKEETDSNINTAITALNLTSYAPISYVDNRVASLVGSASSTLDTLKELADALGNDPNFATTIATQLGTKANSSDVYTKTEADALLSDLYNDVSTDLLDYYTKTETLAQINSSLADYYDKTTMDTKLSNTYSNAQTYINNKIAALVGAAPDTLDTLKELADAFNTNASAIEAINRSIATKANKDDSYTRTQLYTKSEVDDLIAAVPKCKFVFRDYLEEE